MGVASVVWRGRKAQGVARRCVREGAVYLHQGDSNYEANSQGCVEIPGVVNSIDFIGHILGEERFEGLRLAHPELITRSGLRGFTGLVLSLLVDPMYKYKEAHHGVAPDYLTQY